MVTAAAPQRRLGRGPRRLSNGWDLLSQLLHLLQGIVLQVQLPLVDTKLPLRHEVHLAEGVCELLHLRVSSPELPRKVHVAAFEVRYLAALMPLLGRRRTCGQALVRG